METENKFRPEKIKEEEKDEKNAEEIILTEEILSKARMEGKIKNPRALSWRDKEYQEYANHLTISDVESLCRILQYSKEEIFTEENIEPINHYGEINLEGKKYLIGSANVKDILFLIQDGKWNKNDVLYDVSLLLNPKKYSEYSDIKVSIANRLFKEGYIEIDKDWLAAKNKEITEEKKG